MRLSWRRGIGDWQRDDYIHLGLYILHLTNPRIPGTKMSTSNPKLLETWPFPIPAITTRRRCAVLGYLKMRLTATTVRTLIIPTTQNLMSG